MRVRFRDELWVIRDRVALGERTLLRLEALDTTEKVEALCPPDEFTIIPEAPPKLEQQSLTPFGIWRELHEALRLASPQDGSYAAFHSGRIQPEAYQFLPVAKLTASPSRNLLIADDVGLGKTIEAGICMLEMIARGVGKRILLVVPPGLISQWVDEMWEKFGLEFQPIENSPSLDRAQTLLSEGIQPWAYFDRVITSTEYLKRRDVHATALTHPWDVIVVDEAHYLAMSGSPTYPYSTARSRLGPRLREASRSLILLTATPHNGYRHSFRSLLELVEPTDASLVGSSDAVRRRLQRAMIRRLKPQITKIGERGTRQPAFPPRMLVQRIEVNDFTSEERQVFSLVSSYCLRTLDAAEGSEDSDLVSFAMQIIKKRMLSSRLALTRTIKNRMEALNSRNIEEPPSNAELRELQGDLPLGEAVAERTAARILRTAFNRDAKRRAAEKKQLKEIARLLDSIQDRPDPKIIAFLAHLEKEVLPIAGEKAIVFTEYRDTIEALRCALDAHPHFADNFAELVGGLTPKQRKARIARFHELDCRLLIATDAASEGLNLQSQCCRLYHFELPWNPNRLEQRNGRIDRHGQMRPPIIAYLFYPQSPEDRVLDRLIQRISQMHDDRVSTSDILGILSATRIDEALGRVNSMVASDDAAQSLLRVFDERRNEFGTDVAPLLLTGSEDVHFYAGDAFSADPLLGDDSALERLMLRRLESGLRSGMIPGTYKIEVPRSLRGPDVASRYESATFRRSIAVRFPASDVEFIHRLHPLFRAVAAAAVEELTLVPRGSGVTSRIAARRHPSVSAQSIAIFTFLERFTRPDGTLVAIGLSADGEHIDDSMVQAILQDETASVGEVSWSECEKTFAPLFDRLVEIARLAARELLDAHATAMRNDRKRSAELLRKEAILYKEDRLAEIDLEEAAERAGSRTQMELFRETATNWKARRAAVETNYHKRLEKIDAYTQVPEPGEPQPLGVLLAFSGA